MPGTRSGRSVNGPVLFKAMIPGRSKSGRYKASHIPEDFSGSRGFSLNPLTNVCYVILQSF